MRLFLVLLGACSAPHDVVITEPPVGTLGPNHSPTYHQNIAPLLAKHCIGCHTASGSAPFALDNQVDAEHWAALSLAAIDAGRMPPWMPDPECRDLQDARLIGADDVALLRDWIAADMPAGAAVEASPPPAPPDFEPTHVLNATGGYLSTAVDEDEYRCFVLDHPFPTDAYLRGSTATPGTEQVHHILVYAIGESQLSGVFAAESADPEPGFTCFGGPFGDDNPDDLVAVLPPQIAAWVPGNSPAVTAADTAIRVSAGSRIVVQVHYSSVGGTPTPDEDTTVSLWLQDEPTDFLAESTPLPIFDLTIGAGQSNATFTQEFVNYGQEPIELVAMAGHMHLLGTSISAWIHRADGTDECGLSIPAWDFSWQESYRFTEPLMVDPADRIDVTCSFDNSAGESVVNWGDRTLDEMCIIYVVKRAPWTPTPNPDAAICAGADACTDCDGPVDCGLSCDGASGACSLCTLDALSECSIDACGARWLPTLPCLEDCVINAVTFSGTVGDCVRDQCSDSAYEELASCLDDTIAPGGACEGALDACPP